MRATLRLRAVVENTSRYLEVGAPTGLTGLRTHGSPRTTLLYLYSSTLDKLKEFPEHSVYRQATEALTKHRMKVIESVKPAGLEQWQQRIQPLVERHPEAFRKLQSSSGLDIVWKEKILPYEERPDEGVDGAARLGVMPRLREGVQWDELESRRVSQALNRATAVENETRVEVEPEPPLTRDQVIEIEAQLQTGLLEEIIEVAHAEHELAEVMLENKVWEDLEEKPVEGQWTYHERDRHTRGTEAQ